MGTKGSPPAAIFLADSRAGVGLGHVRRAEFYARALSKDLGIVTRQINLTHLSALSMEVAKFSERRHNEQETHENQASRERPEAEPLVLIFDLAWDRIGSFAKLSRTFGVEGHTTIGIDIPQDLIGLFDEYAIPAISEPWRNAKNWGTKWLPIELLEENLVRSRDLQRGVILTGSSSFNDYFPQLYWGLLNRKGEMDFDWYTGLVVPEIPNSGRGSYRIRFSTPGNWDFAESEHGIALSRFGVSLFELLARRIPTIILPNWKQSEESQVELLRSSNAALVANTIEDVLHFLDELENNERTVEKLSHGMSEFLGGIREIHPISELVSKALEF